jgi:hypothetical protein
MLRFHTIAPDAVFEFRYRFPGWPTKLVGREALMALYAGYGEGMALHGADALPFCIESQITREERYLEKMRTAEAMRYQQSMALLQEQGASALPRTL